MSGAVSDGISGSSGAAEVEGVDAGVTPPDDSEWRRTCDVKSDVERK